MSLPPIMWSIWFFKPCRALDYNFFLCLPLANPELSARFARWRDGVLAEPGAAAAGALAETAPACARLPGFASPAAALRPDSCLNSNWLAMRRPAGLEPSVFMHPQHLHLTICMLKLYRHAAPCTACHCILLLHTPILTPAPVPHPAAAARSGGSSRARRWRRWAPRRRSCWAARRWRCSCRGWNP